MGFARRLRLPVINGVPQIVGAVIDGSHVAARHMSPALVLPSRVDGGSVRFPGVSSWGSGPGLRLPVINGVPTHLSGAVI